MRTAGKVIMTVAFVSIFVVGRLGVFYNDRHKGWILVLSTLFAIGVGWVLYHFGSDRPASPCGGADPRGEVAVGRHRGTSTLSEIRRLWRLIVPMPAALGLTVAGFAEGSWLIGVGGLVVTTFGLFLLRRRWRKPGAGD